MIDDTNEVSYTFKLILSNKNFETQIYESDSKSGSLTTKSSFIPVSKSYKVSRKDDYNGSCLSKNGYLYITHFWKDIRTILVYYIEFFLDHTRKTTSK